MDDTSQYDNSQLLSRYKITDENPFVEQLVRSQDKAEGITRGPLRFPDILRSLALK